MYDDLSLDEWTDQIKLSWDHVSDQLRAQGRSEDFILGVLYGIIVASHVVNQDEEAKDALR